jgi:hypothetical protein
LNHKARDSAVPPKIETVRARNLHETEDFMAAKQVARRQTSRREALRLYSSFQYVTLIGGQLCAIVVLLVLQQVLLSTEELKAWSRLIGALLAIIALVMRR